MIERQSNPLTDPRYGTAMTASLGMFDTAGWVSPAAGVHAGFDSGGRRHDYGPKGCAGIVLGAAAFLIVFVAAAVLLAVGVMQ